MLETVVAAFLTCFFAAETLVQEVSTVVVVGIGLAVALRSDPLAVLEKPAADLLLEQVEEKASSS